MPRLLGTARTKVVARIEDPTSTHQWSSTGRWYIKRQTVLQSSTMSSVGDDRGCFQRKRKNSRLTQHNTRSQAMMMPSHSEQKACKMAHGLFYISYVNKKFKKLKNTRGRNPFHRCRFQMLTLRWRGYRCGISKSQLRADRWFVFDA